MNDLRMTIRGKGVEFGPWINRILLAVVAFFLMQQNVKFNEVIEKIEKVLIQQAVSVRDIMEMKGQYNYHSTKIEKLEEKQSRMEARIIQLESRCNK